jgi:glutamate synthase (ferredoxin)
MQIPDQEVLSRTLYDPAFEHDACGIGFVARISGEPSHDILSMALTALCNLAHRGAVSADGKSGDGAGVLTQIPQAFFARELARLGLPSEAQPVGVAMLFLPQEAAARAASERLLEAALARYGLRPLGWRAVPTNQEALGAKALAACPQIMQLLIARRPGMSDSLFETALYAARRQAEREASAASIDGFYVPSLSARSIVYKGLMLGTNLAEFYADLRDPLFTTALAVYHQRYSTNTFPTWERAQPFRLLSHNGEINTIMGNANWMRSREVDLRLEAAQELAAPVEVVPVIDMSGSDSAMLDNALELLVVGGRDVRHALSMLVPEAWEKIADLPPAWRAFYQYHAQLIEPWDGPAALTFSDGRVVGTALDRNGLRPARYLLTDDGLVISGSEVGAVPIDEARIVHKGKLGPGQMIAVDTAAGRFYTNEEIKDQLAARQPYGRWVGQELLRLAELLPKDAPAPAGTPGPIAGQELQRLQHVFGYTAEELAVIIKPMLRDANEPVGSMGDDTPIAVLSQLELGRPLYQFFRQRFAEVTNPPIDPLREELMMSLSISLGARANLLDETPGQAHVLSLPSPVLTDAQLQVIRALRDPAFATATLTSVFEAGGGEAAFNAAIGRLCEQAVEAIRAGAHLLILSDRAVDATYAPLPALLALGAVHHHLLHVGLRNACSLIVESGEPREVHHLACLVGYGAEAVNPYLALASAREIVAERAELRDKTGAAVKDVVAGTGNGTNGSKEGLELTIEAEAERNLVKALEKGLLKVMSKMGISTVDSYCAAQIFEAIGLDDEVISLGFVGTPSRLGGIGLERLAHDAQARHARGFGEARPSLAHPGFYKFKKDGEYHAFSPQVVHALHKAVNYEGALNGAWAEGYSQYRAYAELINKRPSAEPRDLLDFVPAGVALPLEDVEPIEAIVRRFSTAAMSHGSTSSEAHETLSIAMNRLGGLSNSGEGGEAPERYKDERNSKIKQVASGRFGVTPAYLASAEELQIKMAQGSKPGEGGQLPGHKVNSEIAAIRHTVPGVALISPPPHHDIYSIEDLAQLIYDLKTVNPEAAVSVKLVAEAGVGTIAAGVAKGYADVIHISGHNGGTGASPLSSIKNAGAPWELGLAETQQTLVLNDLRGRVRVRVDGGFKTGRDVVIAAMLGADEYSFGTAALVAEGCLMARACHTNTCPVGIATQRPDLRAKFPGKPEQIIAFFRYVAQEIRETLATLGLRSLEEAIGRVDLLRQVRAGFRAADSLNLARILGDADPCGEKPRRNLACRNPIPQQASLNERLLSDARGALSGRGPVELSYSISNRDRSFGARLAGSIGQLYGDKGLPAGTITVRLSGSAGQSFGAFCAPGMRLLLTGEANDYVGKGIAGGEIVVRPVEGARYAWHENMIVGNTVLYGATGGELYAAGRAGERFCVRNSGATAVIEGLGDHGCEYMTGGSVVVLGETGRNFGAGMTGGVAYVLDEHATFEQRYNKQLVQLDPLSTRDEAQVQRLLRRHIELTGSPRASEILARWEVYRPRFVRVMPKDAVAQIENASEGASDGAKPEKGQRAVAA